MRKPVEPIDVSTLPPVTLARLKAACYERDVAGIFRILQGIGYSQRAVAMLTGQSQSEISEILGGRQVRSYDVQVRVFEGVGLPRAWGGLSYADTAAPDVAPPEVVASARPVLQASVAINDDTAWAAIIPTQPQPNDNRRATAGRERRRHRRRRR